MNRSRFQTSCLLALLLALPLAGGCVTSADFQRSLDEREMTIRDLREERVVLKGKIRDLEQLNASLEQALIEAGNQAMEAAAPQAQATPDWSDLGIDTSMRGRDLVISIPAGITFASGRADLSSEGKAALRTVARSLTSDYAGSSLWIEGHTDSDPIKKSKFATNRDLSLARAMAVLHFLVEEASVPDDDCVVVGWGEYRPLAKNDSASNKARNRRVEIVVRSAGS